MARKLKYPIRRHTRLSPEIDKKLQKRAKRLGVTVAVAQRLSIEHSLSQGDVVRIPKGAESEA